MRIAKLKGNSIWSRMLVLLSSLLLLAFAPSLMAADMDGANLENNLRTLEVDAAQVAYHAGELKALLRHPGSFSFESHGYELNRIRERVNDMGEMIPKIQKANLKPVQAEVVDDITGLVKALATQTTKAIEYLDKNGSVNPLTPQDRAYAVRVAGIYHYAEHIDDLIDFAQARMDWYDAQRDMMKERAEIGRQ